MKLRSRVLTSKGKYCAPKRRGNAKNVNSSTEFCVTSFCCHAFALLSRAVWTGSHTSWKVGYENLETVALKIVSKKLLVSEQVWSIVGVEILHERKKKREIHLCLIPTVVESQELLMIFLRFFKPKLIRLNIRGFFGRNVDKSDLI